MTMIKFEVVIKPFFQEVKIKGTKNMNEEVQEFLYDQLDEWGGFTMFDRKFDYHFLYDEEPEFYITEVDERLHNHSTDEEQDVKLIIEI